MDYITSILGFHANATGVADVSIINVMHENDRFDISSLPEDQWALLMGMMWLLMNYVQDALVEHHLPAWFCQLIVDSILSLPVVQAVHNILASVDLGPQGEQRAYLASWMQAAMGPTPTVSTYAAMSSVARMGQAHAAYAWVSMGRGKVSRKPVLLVSQFFEEAHKYFEIIQKGHELWFRGVDATAGICWQFVAEVEDWADTLS